ncbi:MAG: starch-binding protein [Clostridia bacterium]|nr:starch-binding protein [Clostridia bacterium]
MSKTKKVISVVLAAALIMAMATVAMVSASAATTVYFENSEGWGEVYAYVWGGALGEEFGAWPGSPCTQVSDNVWSADIPDDCTNVIFNNNNNGAQTNNLENVGGGVIAKLGTGTEVGEFGELKTVYAWEQYGDAPVETTTAAQVVTTTAAQVVTTTAAQVVTTTATEPSEVITTVATEPSEVITTVASDDEEPTTGATEPSEVITTVATEPSEIITTVATEPTGTTTVEPVADGIVVDDKEYTANVGDEVTYTATLKTPNKIEDVQGYITYDAAKLTVVSATTPNIYGAIINTNEAGTIYFNATEVNNGLDFTTEAVLVEVKFTVNDATYSEIALTIEEMTERNGGSYFTDSQQVNADVTVVEALAVPEVIIPTGTTTVEPTGTTTVEPTATTAVVEPTETDATGITGDDGDDPIDTPPTGATFALYAVIATLAMAAAAVVVLRKKVNG